MSQDVDTFLAHYGVMGMRWGVRSQLGPDGRIAEGSRGSEDHQKARDLKKKGVNPNLSPWRRDSCKSGAYIDRTAPAARTAPCSI